MKDPNPSNSKQLRNPAANLDMKTYRAPGAEIGSKEENKNSFGRVMRPATPDDVNNLNVKQYDTFTPGCPRPFVSVYRFGDSSEGGFKMKVPPVVKGRR